MRRYTRDDALPEYIRARMKQEGVGPISGDIGKADLEADLDALSRADDPLGDDRSSQADRGSDQRTPPQAPA
jgi:hypothetical protein